MSKEIKRGTPQPKPATPKPSTGKEWLHHDGQGGKANNIEKGERGEGKRPVMTTPVPPPKKK